MLLDEALVAFGKKYLNDTNDWYQWRNINSKYLPVSIVLPQGNQYTKNISLKNQLSEHYARGDIKEKLALTRYYIAVWGGVKRNHPVQIRSYALDDPAILIGKGSRGIASWSKALCIRNPDEYAIYDARVAVALNAIQSIYSVSSPKLFPLLKGQNKFINRGCEVILQQTREWVVLAEGDFYMEYNRSLCASASRLGVRIAAIEMLLFSQAPELLQEAFLK